MILLFISFNFLIRKLQCLGAASFDRKNTWLTDTWPTDIWPTDIWLTDIWLTDIWLIDIWPTDIWPTDILPTDIWQTQCEVDTVMTVICWTVKSLPNVIRPSGFWSKVVEPVSCGFLWQAFKICQSLRDFCHFWKKKVLPRQTLTSPPSGSWLRQLCQEVPGWGDQHFVDYYNG